MDNFDPEEGFVVGDFEAVELVVVQEEPRVDEEELEDATVVDGRTNRSVLRLWMLRWISTMEEDLLMGSLQVNQQIRLFQRSSRYL